MIAGHTEAGPLARLRPRLGGVARSVVVVGAATALGQSALILASPVLARLYGPADFGLLSVFTAVLSVLIGVGSLRYDFAIPVADDDAEAVDLLATSVGLGAASTAIVALVVLVGGTGIARALGAEGLAPFLWLLPLGLLVGTVSQALAAWATHARTFGRLGRLRAAQGVGQAGCQAAFGLASAGPLGLLGGDVIGRALGAAQLAWPAARAVRATPPSAAGIRAHARGRWGFARVMVLATLVSEVSLQVPFLLIPSLFGIGSSGQYFLAYRLLVLPASLVAAAVSQVFFGEAALRRADARRLHDLARNVAVSLLVFSVPTYLILAVAGPALIGVVFGSQWGPAGDFARIMAPPLVLWAVASPISTLLLVGRRERESLLFTVLELTVKAGSLLVGGAVHSLTLGLVVMSVTSAAMYVSALWRFLRVAGVRVQDLVPPGARILALTLPSLAGVVLVALAAPDLVLVASAAGWAVAFLLAVRRSPEPRALLSGADD